MPTHKQLLINHLCLLIKELSTLITVIEMGSLTDEQIELSINKLADKLKIGKEV